MTFYLKYRPKTVDELDLTQARERLVGVVDGKKFAHAYLFTGPRGTGKTSAARILAREAGASDIDIIELDAASNRGIDDIRALREKVGLLPASGKKKVYIIDEVHMLTTEAFNALLKTLEEPPSHVLFFLCTTEVEKVPGTIVSRCVHVPFNRATPLEIVRSLARTVAGEKLSVSDDVLSVIATWADGSFREAQTILEQAAGAGGAAGASGGSTRSAKKTVSVEDVERVVGGSVAGETRSYVDGVIAGHAEGALRAISDVSMRGGDVSIFAKRILGELRERLLKNPPSARLLTVTRVVEDRTRSVRYSLIPQLPLEIAALELSLEKKDESSMIQPDKSTQGGEYSQNSKMKSASAEESSMEPRADEIEKDQENVDIKSEPSLLTPEAVHAKWPLILDAVRKKNHGILTLLVHCVPRETKGKVVVVDAKYQFHLEQLGQDKFRSIIESAMLEVLGVPLGVRFRLRPHTEVVLKEFAADDNIRGVGEDEIAILANEIFSS